MNHTLPQPAEHGVLDHLDLVYPQHFHEHSIDAEADCGDGNEQAANRGKVAGKPDKPAEDATEAVV